MANEYSPKLRFQQSTARREQWSKIVADPVFHDALLHTQAQMAAAGFGPQEMVGVNNFIVGLMNLSEDIVKVNPLPAKQLKSYEANDENKK
jgi:hypothetical protein